MLAIAKRNSTVDKFARVHNLGTHLKNKTKQLSIARGLFTDIPANVHSFVLR